ncbi:unnamed protein product [Clonostachys chloroleuca]|uniref:Inosine/uridine-preferring nucleoside hydrolase domain-containing protein n=1 Tax=Clonostachys chloroleuca TaxID=1926264 RepID=A0AA35LT73_9HYPO|nr:unnamed protein product [Clonostachys chloroleuca]
MDHTTLEAKFRSEIPYDYGTEEYNLYATLIPLLGRPRKLLVITDIEQDRDDLLAVILLSHMHSLGIIELVGCVANHRPSDKRAKFLKTVLHVLGTPEIPVAVGTDGTGGRENRTLYWHELQNQTFEEQDWNKGEQIDGYTLIHQLVDSQFNPQKLTALNISSFQDLSEYLKTQDDETIQKHFAKVVSQGGYEIVEGSIKPDWTAMNNKFNREAASYVTNRLDELSIPSDAWGKQVAVAAALDRSFLKTLLGPLGHHLRWVSAHQDYKYYFDALHKPFMPHLGKTWLLEIYMGLNRDSDEFLEMLDQPLSFHTFLKTGKFPAYDACAAMGALGDDVLQCLGILSTSAKPSELHPHRMFGKSRNDLGGVDASKLKWVLQVFLQGSLKATYKRAEEIIPTSTLRYSSPSYSITLDIFRRQQPYMEILEDFKRTKGIQPEETERFIRDTFGENKLLDSAGHPVRDIHGQVCPMIPEEIPYKLLFMADGGATYLQD